MSSNKDFLPSSSPRSSICAVEIEAILFLFMLNCYKSSFQECITIIALKIERQGTSRHIVYFSYKKKEDIPPPPVGLFWDSPHPPQSLYGRTLTSEPKFFGSTGLNQICLPMVLRELRYNLNFSTVSIVTLHHLRRGVTSEPHRLH